MQTTADHADNTDEVGSGRAVKRYPWNLINTEAFKPGDFACAAEISRFNGFVQRGKFESLWRRHNVGHGQEIAAHALSRT